MVLGSGVCRNAAAIPQESPLITLLAAHRAVSAPQPSVPVRQAVAGGIGRACGGARGLALA